ncbi:oligosaccharide repeat unit polymerase Wzy [Lachnospiraceae bacterium KM106-2]|nr:oligosaccharide repeat unit polymerase Wzy [Lachnospiraceae bacterium KM106-2]
MSRRKKSEPAYKRLIGYILVAFLVMLPWVSRLKIYELSEREGQYFSNQQGIYFDLFLYYKSVWIIFMMIVIVCFFLGEHIFPDHIISDIPLKEKQYRSTLWAVLVYIVGVLLSSVFSPYQGEVVSGSPVEFEGTFVLIGYMVLFLAGINYFRSPKVKNALKYGITIVAGITVILSGIEFFGGYLFQFEFFKNLLAGDNYKAIIQSLQTGNFKNMITLTFFNSNYFGSFSVLIFPILAMYLIEAKIIWEKIGYAILTTGMIAAIVGSRSTAAFYLVLLQVIVILIYKRKELLDRWKESLIYIGFFIGGICIINVTSQGKLLEMLQMSSSNTKYENTKQQRFELTDLHMEGNKLTLIGTEKAFTLEYDQNEPSNRNKMKIYDEEEKKLKTTNSSDEQIQLQETGYEPIKLVFSTEGVSIDLGYESTLDFYMTEDGFYGVGQNGIALESVSRTSSIGKRYYSYFTGRGYAWMNSMPLLKQNLLIGKGPGTFLYQFQQYDYVGLLNTHGTTNLMIDKPHNMYLQIALQTGGISLIAVLFLFVCYFMRGMKAFAVNQDLQGVFLGTISFMIIGMVNDSMVVVSPIFWMLLGIGYGSFQRTKDSIC